MILDLRQLDATRLGPKLYQGSYPSLPIARRGFRVLVLCASELQKRGEEDGLVTLRCPLFDHSGAALSRRDWVHALRTGQRVAEFVAGGERVLVTCAEGRNRSGLISAIALHEL